MQSVVSVGGLGLIGIPLLVASLIVLFFLSFVKAKIAKWIQDQIFFGLIIQYYKAAFINTCFANLMVIKEGGSEGLVSAIAQLVLTFVILLVIFAILNWASEEFLERNRRIIGKLYDRLNT